MAPRPRPKPTPLHHQAYAALTGGVIFLVAALVARHKDGFGDFSGSGGALVFLLWTLAAVALGAGLVLLQGARTTPR